MRTSSFIKQFYAEVLTDKEPPVAIKCIDDIGKTEVSYEQRIKNENWTFDNKPRDENTGNEIAVDNHFVIDYLILERKLSAYRGQDLWKYIENFVNNRKFTRILSIGAGPAAVEREIAANFTSDYQLDCIDINEELVNFATKKAQSDGLNFHPIVGDANDMAFDEEYDIIMVVAALHHFITLEELFHRIGKALKPDGEFVTYEPICRNGMFLFRSQRIILGLIFSLLPSKYRLNHQDYPESKKIDRFYHEYDRSGWTFECIRSGDIANLLKENFDVKHWGRGTTFLRRVSDSLYGPNYEFNNKKDRLIIKILCLTDRFVRFLRLAPIEGLFFIGKKPKKPISR